MDIITQGAPGVYQLIPCGRGHYYGGVPQAPPAAADDPADLAEVRAIREEMDALRAR
jgi:hypothetical protein